MNRKDTPSIQRIGQFILSLFLWSVAVNYPWEMIQMPLYEAMPFSDPMSWMLCFRASLGDGFIIILIWSLGHLVFRDRLWFTRRKMANAALLLTAGGAIAIFVEIHALQSGRWSYSDLMPLVPVAGVGWSPFVQLLILPFFSMRLAAKIPLVRTACE